MNATKTSDSPTEMQHAIENATRRIAPLWPLSRFVAVNPFVGLSDLPFAAAAEVMTGATGSPLSMPPAFYRERFREGEILRDDLMNAAQEAGYPSPCEGLVASILQDEWAGDMPPMTPLPSSVSDALQGSQWEDFFASEVSKWCAAYFDKGQALWQLPWKSEPLFSAWVQAASLDLSPECAGLKGWREFVRGLPTDPVEAIARSARQLGIPDSVAAEVFHRLLMTVRGWAGHLQFLAHEKKLRGGSDDGLIHLLAIRISCEAALHSGSWNDALEAEWEERMGKIPGRPNVLAECSEPRIWQRAHEIASYRRLFSKLAGSARASAPSRPSFQAVFCIDVRSEIYRRALESVSPDAGTAGFAGFFGFPIEAVGAGEKAGAPQCPVLLAPVVKVPAKSAPGETGQRNFRKRAAAAWNAFKSSAVSSFVFVETVGLGFAVQFARDLARRSSSCSCGHHDVDISGIPDDQQATLAAGALRHMGFGDGSGLSRLVVLCGHGSETANNPFGSSLDCGACGGHSGEANARTAAAVLNNPAVRTLLSERGVNIPHDTWFLAALHNTTTDEVTVFDADRAPSGHKNEISDMLARLSQASRLARRERAALLGEDPSEPDLAARITDRSRDWSQVRPEWGLAGNYAFVAAPRSLTRGLALDGRVFLHDYRHAADPGEATLELILAAPVVVASWINLQYFASTVDNARFGAGNKVLHNVAGTLGVLEGNGGDLRVGLPLQSVHDGADWRHEPLRLAVCVAAPCEAIDGILAKHPEVAALVANAWIHLYAITESGEVLGKSDGLGGWGSVSVKPEGVGGIPGLHDHAHAAVGSR